MHAHMYNTKMRVEWSPAKARANLEKHGVAFSEAATVLSDDWALTREDPDCRDEWRFVTLGLSATGQLLVVVYTHREPNVFGLFRPGAQTSRRGNAMKKTDAEPFRDIDFSIARRGAVLPTEPGKTRITIRLDNAVLEHFRRQVEQAGGGNYQTLINDALVAFIQQESMLESVRQVVREELAEYK